MELRANDADQCAKSDWRERTGQETQDINANREVRELCDRVVQGVHALRDPAAYLAYLDCMSKFPTYSYRNVLLIADQMPEATRVNSFSGWQKMHRTVQRGEKGIRILVPVITKGYKAMPAALTGEKSEEYTLLSSFQASSVFDVSQTRGATREQISPLIQGVEDCDLLHFAMSNTRTGSARTPLFNVQLGNMNLDTGGVSVQGIDTTADQICAAAHEAAHRGLAMETDTNRRELEAQSACYVFLKHFGLDPSTEGLERADMWPNTTDEQLRRAAAFVSQEAGSLIAGVAREIQRPATRRYIAAHRVSRECKAASYGYDR